MAYNVAAVLKLEEYSHAIIKFFRAEGIDFDDKIFGKIFYDAEVTRSVFKMIVDIYGDFPSNLIEAIKALQLGVAIRDLIDALGI